MANHHHIPGDRDAGLEAFLHLLDPDIALPELSVEPAEIDLRLEFGDTREIPVIIRNLGRGYLHGTIEVSDPNQAFKLSTNRFFIDSKSEEEVIIQLRIDTNRLEAGRSYQTTMVLSSNSSAGQTIIPVSILAVQQMREALYSSMYIFIIFILSYFIYSWTYDVSRAKYLEEWLPFGIILFVILCCLNLLILQLIVGIKPLSWLLWGPPIIYISYHIILLIKMFDSRYHWVDPPLENLFYLLVINLIYFSPGILSILIVKEINRHSPSHVNRMQYIVPIFIYGITLIIIVILDSLGITRFGEF